MPPTDGKIEKFKAGLKTLDERLIRVNALTGVYRQPWEQALVTEDLKQRAYSNLSTGSTTQFEPVEFLDEDKVPKSEKASKLKENRKTAKDREISRKGSVAQILSNKAAWTGVVIAALGLVGWKFGWFAAGFDWLFTKIVDLIRDG
ncbi:MAG: hypothetical protein QF654_05180 [Alphaproteobacteria bacterium]|jgi:phage shock protein A|nr:hypothetical protein [Alphaproteobacteria bacterium]MDP6602637.1 hypothetical protein [Rhodospirillales bacterium]